MRISNYLIFSALLILIISLAVYNSELKAEYLTGKYKDPYKDYKSINIKDFNEVEIKGANLMFVELEQGDYAVRQKNNSVPIKFNKVGNRLMITVDYNQKPDLKSGMNRYDNAIIILCPQLNILSTTNGYLVNGKAPKESHYSIWPDDGNSMIIKKFKTDSLSFIQHSDGNVYFQNNTIGSLKISTSRNSKINIDKSNTIQKADMQIHYKSELFLNNILIPQLTYHLDDSSQVTLAGRSLNILHK